MPLPDTSFYQAKQYANQWHTNDGQSAPGATGGVSGRCHLGVTPRAGRQIASAVH